MMQLAPQARGLAAAALIAAVLLALVLALVPPMQQPSAKTTTTLAPVVATFLPDPELEFVAQDEPSLEDEAPTDPSVDGAFNRRVERETVARIDRPALDRPRTPTPEVLPEASTGASANDKAPLKLDLDIGELAAPKPNLFDIPSLQGGPYVHDPSIAEGERTWISSRRVQHGGFFRRLHQAVKAEWDPNSVMLRRDPSGMLYGTQDRQTVLYLRLSPSGYLLEDPRVVSSSGLKFLDQEAVRAVVAAAPFANPPRALVREGLVDLGRFSFYLRKDRLSFHLRREP